MKKLVLTSLTIILSGCGGEELFNEPASDMQTCIVGSWNNEGQLPDFAYAENYTFFADGTMQRDFRQEVPLWLRFAASLNEELGPVPRYGVTLQTGAWEFRNGMLYIAAQHRQVGAADTEADALAMAIALTAPGVPMENSPSWTEYDGATTHCDEEFFKMTGVYKKTGESPLTYKRFYSSSSPDAVSPYISERSYTFYPDGTGIRNDSSPIVYSYEGNVMSVITQDCESCSTSLFIDHGHTLSRSKLESALFVRQN